MANERARGPKPGRLSARYWRLRFADDVDERLAELDEERERFEYDDRWDDDRWRDPSGERLDALILALRLRLRAAGAFHALVIPGRRATMPIASPTLPATSLEPRLIEHHERLTTRTIDELEWLDDIDADLIVLESIAEPSEYHYGVDPIAPLLGLLMFRPFWLRPLASWTRPAGSRSRVIASLIEHLLVAFPTPRFLIANWGHALELDDLRWMSWTIALAQGGSLRRLSELAHARWPEAWAKVGSKLSAALERVPDSWSPTLGLMAAEVVRLGGSLREATWLARDPSFRLDPSAPVEAAELEFWRSTLAWLIRHGDALDDDAAARILAWARHRQTERHREDGCFDWHGRTLATVQREALTYQHSRSYVTRWLSWRARGWDWQGRIGERDWSIVELTRSETLRVESQAMSHCVWTYDLACWRGETAIFSLRQGDQRRATIEVRIATKRIVQAKRAFNQAPSELEHAVIEAWWFAVVEPSS
ncbi:PcfJ domain-containing protein [Nannocystaceae bacterium ST9]